uniref:Uncharacterized protein n=1 Tax=Anguilla anguilla TaxID=7936 RepID=A0A0E9PVJ9_ANGAN
MSPYILIKQLRSFSGPQKNGMFLTG